MKPNKKKYSMIFVRDFLQTVWMRAFILLIMLPFVLGTGKSSQGMETYAATVTRKYGDINGDGTINNVDQDLLLKHVATEVDKIRAQHPDWVLKGVALKAADINCDGEVDSRDTLKTIQHISATTQESVRAKHPDWVLKKTFTYDDGKTKKVTFTTYYVTANSGLVLRKGRGTGYAKILTMPYGASVSIENGSINGGWAKAKYKGSTGFCSTSYISKTKPKKSEKKKVQERLDKIISGKLTYNKKTVMKKGRRFIGYRANEQCKGYAKNVFYLCFKVTPGTTRPKPNNYKLYSVSGMKQIASKGKITKANVKSLFSNARPGDFVQIRRKHTGSHSAIVYSVTSTGVTFLEANLDGKNTVYLRTYTWANLASKNAGMSVYTPSKYKLK